VALLGLPNVGKSSLFNALAGEDAALVSPQPGATRDYVVRRVEWQGVRLALMDNGGRGIARQRCQHYGFGAGPLAPRQWSRPSCGSCVSMAPGQ
jgi:small GTP-binding protein